MYSFRNNSSSSLSHTQTTYKDFAADNILAKGDVAHDDHFLFQPNCFQLFFNNLYFQQELLQDAAICAGTNIFCFSLISAKSSASDLLYVGMNEWMYIVLWRIDS